MINSIVEFATKEPSKIALKFKDKSLTYSQLIEEIFRFSQLNFQPYSGIIITESNPLKSIPLLLGANLANKPCIFASNQLNAAQIEEIAQETNFAISSNLDFETTLPLQNFKIEQKDDFVFLGILTSGTTAKPKIIWKDYGCWISAFPHQTTLFSIDKNTNLFVVNALGYSANLNAVLHHLWQGGSCFFENFSSIKEWNDIFINENIKATFLVPSHLQLFVNQCTNSAISLESIVTAGEKLAPVLAQKTRQLFPTCTLTEYYGAAELGHISYHQNDDIINFPLTVGKAFPGVKIEIKENQINVYSPYISPDFRNINTVHDLGYWQENRLLLLGRAGRMFNRRGVNIFAEEIEAKALEFEGIKEAVAISQKLNNNQDEIWLFFTSKSSNFSTTERKKKIKTFLLQKLSSTKCPQKFVEVDFIPRLSNGKIDFQLLSQIHHSILKN